MKNHIWNYQITTTMWIKMLYKIQNRSNCTEKVISVKVSAKLNLLVQIFLFIYIIQRGMQNWIHSIHLSLRFLFF